MRTKTFFITVAVLVAVVVVLQMIHSVLLDHLDEYNHTPLLPAGDRNQVNIYQVVRMSYSAFMDRIRCLFCCSWHFKWSFSW